MPPGEALSIATRKEAAMDVQSLADGFGAVVRGIDLRRQLDDATVRSLVDVLHRHRVMLLPGQELEPAQFVRYGRHFGDPHPHVLEHKRLPGHPDILLLSNVFRNGEPVGIFDGARFWHTDNSYEADPASATILYSIEAPEAGGDTLIADMVAAYEALSESMRSGIDGLMALHSYQSGGADGELADDAQRSKVSMVEHPLVRRHPATGRKSLYAVAGSIRGIRGMPQAEADVLIAELRAHALKPEFQYAHHYAVGDVIAWDTLQTLHTATEIAPASGPRDTRLLHRISVKGLPPSLRIDRSAA
jgi:taurine dioxygenase